MVEARTQSQWRPRRAAAGGGGGDAAAARALAAELRLHPLVAELLLARGIDAPAAAQFLKPRLSDLSDPLRIPGVDRAARRIVKAIADGQPIVIYGDYDVDGITASAILWHTLRHCGGNVQTYVPHRIDEGYGLNEDAIRTLANRPRPEHFTAHDSDSAAPDPQPTRKPLIISVDCGITAVGPARVARELGVDLIITDHHHCDPDNLPDAYALVHPGLAGDEKRGAKGKERDDAPRHAPDAPHTTLHDLCGAGVAFKLAWQVAKTHCGTEKVPASFRELLMDLLSFVALGTVADVVPLVGENRVLTMFGLRRVKDTRFVGLNALIDTARLRDEKVSSYHVGFVLGPRLNACGRMGHAARAVHLLTAANEAEARETAAFLTTENDRRRATERAIFDEAYQMVLDAGYHAEDTRAIVLGKQGWHSGVIGIVASRLVEAFCRPVVMLSIADDGSIAQGSARSVDGISIHEGLCACADHLDRFGGHAMAAGLALRLEAIDDFRASLVSYVNRRLAPDELVSVVEYDAALALEDCTLDLFDQILMLEPFGRGNPPPRLLLRGVTLDRPAQRMGQNGRHLSLMLRQRDRIVRAVAFGMGDRADDLPAGLLLDVVFEPKVSTWQNLRRPDLHIKALRETERV